MKRVLCLVRKHLAALEGETDRRLLDSFLADHDEAAACAAAGFAKASFSHYERRVRVEPYTTVFRTRLLLADAVPSMRPGVIDLTKYASRKR